MATRKYQKYNKSRKYKLKKHKSKKRVNKKRFSKKVLRGGKPSPGLDQLGYSWNGANINTWPGVLVNNNGITQSNHFKLSRYGVPVGGVVPARSTDADPTLNSSFPIPNTKYNLIGGYKYPQKISSPNKKKKNLKKSKENKKMVGGFFNDIRNFARYLENNLENRVNNARGMPEGVGPMPTDQPGIDKNVKIFVSDPIDVEGIYRGVSESVAKI